mmetsp:Transcript_129/g.333  ORF Transcript_129/g.333 Transcript_129/m.333 type:complete len:338 (+) Transcript_129:238-1251(+)
MNGQLRDLGDEHEMDEEIRWWEGHHREIEQQLHQMMMHHRHPWHGTHRSTEIHDTKGVCKLIRLMVHVSHREGPCVVEEGSIKTKRTSILNACDGRGRTPLHCLLEGSANPHVLEALLDGCCTDPINTQIPSVLDLMMAKAPRNGSPKQKMYTPLQQLEGPDIPDETLRIAAEYLHHPSPSDASRFHPNGMFPLQIVIERCCNHDDGDSREETDSRFFHALVKACPDAARFESKKDRRLPLHSAIAEKRVPLSCIDDLLNHYPDSLSIPDPTTGLPNSLLAAAMHPQLDVIYSLIRKDPSILKRPTSNASHTFCLIKSLSRFGCWAMRHMFRKKKNI